MHKTGRKYRLVIRVLMTVFLISGIVGATLADNEEEEQLRQAAYQKIMERALGSVITGGMGEGRQNIGKKNMDVYKKIKETKVLVSCIHWYGNSVEDLNISNWWVSSNPFGGRLNLGDLRRGALNNCKNTAKGKVHDCKCQIVDGNDKNKLKLPKDWKARVLASEKGNFPKGEAASPLPPLASAQGLKVEPGEEQRRLSRSEVRSLLLGNTEVGVLRRPTRPAVEGYSGQTYKAYYQDNNTVWYKLDAADDIKRWDWRVLKTGVVCRGPDMRGKLAWCRAITPDGAGGYKAVGFRTGNLRYQFRVEKDLFGLPEHLLK